MKIKQNKKEVIYFTGFSMLPPLTVQLKDNNQGIIRSYTDEKTVLIKDYKKLNFWDKVDELNIWNWRRKYPYSKLKYEPMTDGFNWELKLRHKNGRNKYCSGYESYPRNYKKFIDELSILFETKLDF